MAIQNEYQTTHTHTQSRVLANARANHEAEFP
jgi:hypothetical protein